VKHRSRKPRSRAARCSRMDTWICSVRSREGVASRGRPQTHWCRERASRTRSVSCHSRVRDARRVCGAARRADSTGARGARRCRGVGEAADAPNDGRYAVVSRRRRLRWRPNQGRPAALATGTACRQRSCGRAMGLSGRQQRHRERNRDRCRSTGARIRTRRVPKPGSTSTRAPAPRPRPRQLQPSDACSSSIEDSRGAHFHLSGQCSVALLKSAGAHLPPTPREIQGFEDQDDRQPEQHSRQRVLQEPHELAPVCLRFVRWLRDHGSPRQPPSATPASTVTGMVPPAPDAIGGAAPDRLSTVER
jgi:hypothetical protein